MSESEDLRRLANEEWARGNKEMSARYHERASRAAQSEREREAQKPWEEAVRKWLPIFKRHGFDGHGVDFGGVKVEAIEAMGNALLGLEGVGQTVCISCLVDNAALADTAAAAAECHDCGDPIEDGAEGADGLICKKCVEIRDAGDE